MANNKNFKVKNGLTAARYFLSNSTPTLGSLGYSIGDASYDSVSLSITSQTASNAFSVDVSSDGTKIYVFAQSGTVFQYNMSTAWDLSTATYSNSSYEAFTGGTGTPNSVRFSTDGTKMYIISVTPDTIYQYTLGTAWDISTVTYDSVTFVVTSQDSSPTSLYFKSDGTKMYILGNANDTVYQYSLGTAWNVSSATYDTVSLSLFTGTLNSITFNNDGTKFFIMDNADDTLYEYALTTAWDLSTASSTGVTYNATTQDSASRDVAFKSDGTKMYLVGSTGDSVYQYSTSLPTQTLDLSAGNYFSFTPSAATTVYFTNPPASGTAATFSVEIIGDGSAITWPTNVKWPGGTTPTVRNATELYTFITTDSGTTYYGKKAYQSIAEELG